MSDILALAMPFFGLIFLGYASGKIVRIPAEGLSWLNFFIVYIALPALFFNLISRTPIEQLANWSYVLSTTFATYCAFAIAFSIGILINRGDIAESTIQGLVGAYSNIGYMGPGLTLAAFGTAAAVPTALIFCFDNTLLFILAPLMMAIAGTEQKSFGETAFIVAKRVLLHPFILATIVGVIGAAIEFKPPGPIEKMLGFLQSAAAPCALFTLGVTVALRPLKKVPLELPAMIFVKLIVHPLIVWVLLGYIGDFDPVWVYTAMLMAGLPPALNVFVIAQQYGVYVERASSAVLVGTVVSVATVTGLLYIVTGSVVPADLFPG
ncbi:MAG: AEC family transporter [Hyphomicrobiales bacterium]|nr:AEC family transporter [Hyphomicrobiales bacterium]